MYSSKVTPVGGRTSHVSVESEPTELEKKISLVGLKAIKVRAGGPLDKGKESTFFEYMRYETADKEVLFVKISDIIDRLGWTERREVGNAGQRVDVNVEWTQQEVRDVFGGEKGLDKLFHAAQLREVMSVEAGKGVVDRGDKDSEEAFPFAKAAKAFGVKIVEPKNLLETVIFNLIAYFGDSYVKVELGKDNFVFMKTDQVIDKVIDLKKLWTKKRVKKAFNGTNKVDQEKLKEAILQKTKKIIAPTEISSIFNTSQPTLIGEVAQRALEALKSNGTFVHVYRSKSGSEERDSGGEEKKLEKRKLMIIDYKDLAVRQGEELGEGASLLVFKVGEVAMRIHSPNVVRAGIEGVEEKEKASEKEEAVMDQIGEHPGVQKRFKEKEVCQITYASQGADLISVAGENKGVLKIRETTLYDGDMKGFIEENKDKPDYKAKVLSMQAGIAKAYQHIHTKNCFHLDGKLDNVFYEVVGGKANAVLGDFGEGQHVGDKAEAEGSKVRSTVLNATPSFTPPRDSIFRARKLSLEEKKTVNRLELNQDERDHYRRLDCFQQGVMFYQMAIGSSHEEDLPYSLERNRPHEIKAEAREKLEAFYGKGDSRVDCIMRMISMNPEERPGDNEIVRAFAIQESSST